MFSFIPMNRNIVYAAQSIDGFIAGKNGELDWLSTLPNPDNDDMGYTQFIEGIDAIIMGRNTFETVCAFDSDWPYQKPVFVLSHTLNEIPAGYASYASLLNGKLSELIKELNAKGFNKLYIDGGRTVQSFIDEDLIDEMIITVIPVLLGQGIPLFRNNGHRKHFKLKTSKIYLNQIVQLHYQRKRV